MIGHWAKIPVWVDPIDNKEVYRCPHRYAYEAGDEVSRLFRFYRGYQDGFLPFSGSLQQQPSNLVECFAEISSVKAILDRQDMEESNNNSGNDDNGGFKSVLQR